MVRGEMAVEMAAAMALLELVVLVIQAAVVVVEETVLTAATEALELSSSNTPTHLPSQIPAVV